MYANPKDIRSAIVKVRLTEDHKEKLERLAMFRREQTAKLAHDLLMDALDQLANDIESDIEKEDR